MLAEIREDEATGAIAATYADIRATLRAPVVNYIWRHLATIDGALPWCWSVVSAAAPQIQASLTSSRHLIDRLVAEHDLHLPGATLPRPPGAAATIESYNRGNGWNLLSMTLLAAARAGQTIDPARPGAPAPDLPPLDVPPFPRTDELGPEAAACIATLSAAGPAAASGVRPSLWVHLAHWPPLLAEFAQVCPPLLGSAAFAAAHARLLAVAPGLLDLDIPPPAREAPDREEPQDRAIRIFRSRIAEMVLMGRILAASP